MRLWSRQSKRRFHWSLCPWLLCWRLRLRLGLRRLLCQPLRLRLYNLRKLRLRLGRWRLRLGG